MKIKSRVQVVLYKENSDVEQAITVIVNGDHLSYQDCEDILEYYPEAWYIGGFEVVETIYDLTD